MKFIITIIGLFVLTSINQAQTGSNTQTKKLKKQDHNHVKNIILMIGDGMGLTQVYAGMTVNHGHLNLEMITNIGFSKTYSVSHYITDSGAGGTALSTGFKTYNGAIGVDKDTIHKTTILEYAEKNNKSTGLVATCTITHATPASFIAHQPSRKMMEEIAADFLKTDIEVFFGGGLDNFRYRKDGLDLTKQLAGKGYQLIYSPDSIPFAKSQKVAGLLYKEHPPKYSDGRGEMLTNASLKAIEILNQNSNGFFLMIEGSQIDWGGHDNDASYVVNEMIDFDRVIGQVLEFARKDGNTLVIVTADHETGGMGLNGGNIEKGEVNAKFTTGDHTGVMVPVFAFGPGSDAFRGIYENTEIFHKMMMAFGFSGSGKQ
jgi:alkaline phosphatase